MRITTTTDRSLGRRTAIPDEDRESAREADSGQSTVEYVLVMLAAAGLAVALITWIGGTDLIPSFFDSVFQTITGYVA